MVSHLSSDFIDFILAKVATQYKVDRKKIFIFPNRQSSNRDLMVYIRVGPHTNTFLHKITEQEFDEQYNQFKHFDPDEPLRVTPKSVARTLLSRIKGQLPDQYQQLECYREFSQEFLNSII